MLILTNKKFYLAFFYFLSLTLNMVVANEIWFTSSGDYKSSKYSNLTNINKDNIKKLDVSWIYENGYLAPTKNFRISNQSTPIFTGKSLIMTSLDGYLISLDPSNGSELWRLKLRKPVGKRGLIFNKGNIFTPTSQGIVVVREDTGKINETFGEKGFIGKYGERFDTLVPPIINENNIFVAHRTKIESYSLPDGKSKWKLDLNGSRVWSGISFDTTTNTILAVTSNLVKIIKKTDIKNDFSNSFLLINGKNGDVRCKFKDTLHDHWDLDMTGNPIVANVKLKNGKTTTVAYAFSKTGNTFVVNIKECKLINISSIKVINTKSMSPIINQTYSSYQNKITNPTKLMSLNYDLEEYLTNIKNDKVNYDYVKFRSRSALYNNEYIPLSLNYDVIMTGIHGGPEWPGGTLDKLNNQIIITTNHHPWIIRSYYLAKEKKIIDKIKYFLSRLEAHEGKTIYENKCASCHQSNKHGVYESEMFGDNYIPSLIGVSYLDKFKSLDSLEKFNFSHSYTKLENNLTNKDLNILKDYFKKNDEFLKDNNLLEIKASWQLFLDKYKNLASIPPFGKIRSINLDNGKLNWDKPFGKKDINPSGTVNGDINFGGTLSTAGQVVFATGTPDNLVRVYNSKNGQILWQYKMKYAGSSPPMTYFYKEEQYVIINSSGGRYFGYDNITGDRIYAFKIKADL